MKHVIAKVQTFFRAVMLLFVMPRDITLLRDACDYRFGVSNKVHSAVVSAVAFSVIGFAYHIGAAVVQDIDVNFRLMAILAAVQTVVLLAAFVALAVYTSRMCNADAILARIRQRQLRGVLRRCTAAATERHVIVSWLLKHGRVEKSALASYAEATGQPLAKNRDVEYLDYCVGDGGYIPADFVRFETGVSSS